VIRGKCRSSKYILKMVSGGYTCGSEGFILGSGVVQWELGALRLVPRAYKLVSFRSNDTRTAALHLCGYAAPSAIGMTFLFIELHAPRVGLEEDNVEDITESERIDAVQAEMNSGTVAETDPTL
jgi:hypothetical protein